MKRVYWIRPPAAAAAAVMLLTAWHITPTVVLRKQADVIRETLPQASQFFLRTVEIGRAELERIKDQGDFTPDDPEVKFYLGRNGNGELDGVVLFPQTNTQHGPFEVGLTIRPDGAIASAVVTKATVETKPWVLKSLQAGLMNGFTGMTDPARAMDALNAISEDDLGHMPYYTATVIAGTVRRGLILYRTLYTEE
jgi:hypothetical protein